MKRLRLHYEGTHFDWLSYCPPRLPPLYVKILGALDPALKISPEKLFEKRPGPSPYVGRYWLLHWSLIDGKAIDLAFYIICHHVELIEWKTALKRQNSNQKTGPPSTTVADSESFGVAGL